MGLPGHIQSRLRQIATTISNQSQPASAILF